MEMSGVAGRITKEVKTIAEGHTQLAKELEEVRSLQRNLTNTLERLATTTAKAEEALRNPPAATPHARSGPDLTGRPTYAATLTHVLPASHATSLVRQDTQFRQVLIDIKGGDNEETTPVLTEAEYVKKAMVTLDLMRDDNFPPPDNLRFLTVRRLRNGGLLYEINTREGAAWLQKPDNMRQFTSKFGHDAIIRVKYYQVMVRNTPVYFQPEVDHVLRELEDENGWTRGEVVAAHWIKPVAKRRVGQERAHLILKLNTPQRANETIMGGISILGRRLAVEKLRKEAR